MTKKNQSHAHNPLIEENQRLHRAVDELSILNEIATAISSTLSLEKIVDLIVQKCIKHLKVEQAAVLLLDKTAQENPFRTMLRRADKSDMNIPLRFNDQLSGWMLKYRKPLLINDFSKEPQIHIPNPEDFPIRTLLCVPLFSKGEMLGLMACFNKKGGGAFTEGDQRLLAIISTQSAQVIENARLLEEEQALFKIQDDLRLASRIQLGLLPEKDPDITGYDISGVSFPAQVVGGDYYDYISVDNEKIAICLGDISGKGLSAALLMANLQATIRGQTLLNAPSKECLNRSNQLLFKSTGPLKFATLFYSILDIKQHKICYANAGHNPPIIKKQGKKPVFLEKSGIPLSFMEDFSYDEDIIPLSPGDLIVIYSDGITEAMNDKEEDFGEERLIQYVESITDQNSECIIQEIIEKVNNYTGSHPQSDDMTLVVIKRN